MNQIQIAAQFYDAHDALWRLLGKEKFTSSIAPYCRALKQRMADMKIDEMKAALYMLKELPEAVPDIQDRTVATMYILAATVKTINSAGKTPKSAESEQTVTSQDTLSQTPR